MEGGAAPTNVLVPDLTEDPAPVKTPSKAGKKTDETSGKKPPREGKDKITPAMREEIWDKYIGDKAKAKCPVCQTSDIKSTKFSAASCTHLDVSPEAARSIRD